MEKSRFVIIKKVLIVTGILLVIFASLFVLFDAGIFSGLSSVKFDKTALDYINTQVSIYDKNNQLIQNDYLSTKQVVSLDKIPQHVKDAFVSIEDHNFYSHKGLNYKRIVKAVLTNLKSLSYKEGASTISQQLIKNTHLTNEKTLSRKIDEILLTQQLEKVFSKDEILQAYLNVIYFGSGTFGIEQASKKYFNTTCDKLTLTQGATLAGIIKSPKTYSPLSNPEKCLKRRNTVLTQMYKNSKITQNELNLALKEPLNVVVGQKAMSNNDYIHATIDQACKILNITEKDFVLNGYKVYTYYNPTLQQSIIDTVEKVDINTNLDKLCMVIDSNNGGIIGYYGKSNYNLQEIKRQPGSTIKPILSYAPALEYNLITPNTPILDKSMVIGDYKPKNYQDKYYGWTDIKTSLINSQNIPAVKLLDCVGIDRAKKFAKQLGITFEDKDTGYAIALGGFDKGLTIKQVANSYVAFSNDGYFVKANFIDKIENKYGRIVYKNPCTKTKVMSQETCYFMTDMLKTAAKTGTARKLANSTYDVASKTGTVGSNFNTTNTDAWNVAYTPNYVVCSWIGNTSGDIKNNLSQQTTGANQPTLMSRQILDKLNDKDIFATPDSIISLPIDMLEYKQNNAIKIASSLTPERYIKYMNFAKNNQPKQTSTRFEKIDDIKIKHTIYPNKIDIIVPTQSYIKYKLYKIHNGKTNLLCEFENKNGNYIFEDKDVESNNYYQYYVTSTINLKNGSISKDSNKLFIYKTDNKKTISNNEIVWD